MKKLTKIDRAACGVIREALNEVLPAAAVGLGLTGEAGNASFDPDKGTVTFKVTFTLEGAEPDKVDFERYAPIFGLTGEDYGRTIKWAGRSFKLVGINPRGSKYPFVGEDRGKRYKLPEQAVVAQ